ncbi:STAS domain-containing protein [Kitasatospora purpeofusca]|uniref:STAS domain-containing protein n=1 Tax=Kitasatospora purpeofusca TaxID=67352 RepID=UPI00225777B3|nr:STAS domain-containing protein [Kitasatospora purpeofusca]MCX4758619.1 STAS domain-containing protein [Kitasatospora purpeofusca]WSR37117.1 STAS domain-containing protein [Kitasatospora purpeofusca]
MTYGERHGWMMVHISGDLDLPAVNAARDRLLQLIWQGCRHLVIDLGGLRSCDAGAFAVLAAARRHMSARDGELRLVLPAPGAPAGHTLGTCGAGRVFDVHETAAEAVADRRPLAVAVTPARYESHTGPVLTAPIPQQRG